MSTSELSWSRGPANSRGVRVLLYAQYGVFGGLIFLLLVGVSYLLVHTLLSGDSNSQFFFILLIVGWFLAWTGIIERASRTTLRQTRLFDGFYRVSRPRWYAVVTLLGAGIHYLLFMYSLTVWAFVFFLSVPVLSIGSQLLSSEGELNRDTRTLTYRGNDIDFELITDIRRATIGDRTILWLSFVRGRANISTPQLLVLPTQLVEDAWPIFETGLAQEVEPVKTDRKTQFVFFGAALGFLGVAVAVGVLLIKNEGLVVATGLSGVFAMFGLLFLWLAIFDR